MTPQEVPMSKGGHFLNKQPKKKGKKIALIILEALLILVIGVAAAGVLYYDSIMEKIKYVTVETKDVEMNEEIENLIALRQAARKEKNFARADEIRNELLEKGIILKDTREGVKWQRA